MNKYAIKWAGAVQEQQFYALLDRATVAGKRTEFLRLLSDPHL